MTTKTETLHRAGFLESVPENFAAYCCEVANITAGNLIAGTLLKTDGSGGYIAWNGTGTAIAILLDAVDASAATKSAVIVKRGPVVVRAPDLTAASPGVVDNAEANLAALSPPIIMRGTQFTA